MLRLRLPVRQNNRKDHQWNGNWWFFFSVRVDLAKNLEKAVANCEIFMYYEIMLSLGFADFQTIYCL